MLFSGFEFSVNLNVIQHTGVLALYSSFEFNANLDAIQHTGVLHHFPVLTLMQIGCYYIFQFN